MRRILFPALLLLPALAPPARATMITGYAMGYVTTNLSEDDGSHQDHPYVFAVGEVVGIVFRYDDAAPDPYRPTLSIDMTTSGGYDAPFGDASLGPTRLLQLEGGVPTRLYYLDSAMRDYDLTFDGDIIRMTYSREMPAGGEGFRATLRRADAPPPLAAPEPSSLSLGLVGAALAGAGWLRRRRA